MSRRNIKPVAALLIVFVLLSISATTVSASYFHPYSASSHEDGGTWANRLSRVDFPLYGALKQFDANPTEQIIEPAVDLAAAALSQFSSSVKTGVQNQISGVFVNDVLAYPVVQQPSGSAAFVSSQAGVVTQFSLAAQYGTVGILAHNFLAGASFFNLSYGQDIYAVYGDGSTAHFVISQVRRFQALDPYSPYSNFIDLDNQVQYTANDVFFEVYGKSGNLVLQTCIAAEGVDSWGRLFIIAEKIS